MRYENVTKAVFMSRPNRFIAEVEIDGRRERVHVKNTGRCRELLIPGCEVWLTAPGNAGRKTKYDLVAVRKGNGMLINIDSQAPNRVMKEWLQRLAFSRVIPEYTYGDSRIDFYMEADVPGTDGLLGNRQVSKCTEHDAGGETSTERYLMEVKGCTLEIDRIGYFPDAPTQRGVKHIRELIRAKQEGYHSILAFVIQMDGVSEVRPNIDTHPQFADAMEDAKSAGVETAFFTCHVEPDKLEITGKNP